MSASLTDTQTELVRVAMSISSGGARRQRESLESGAISNEPTTTLMRDFGGLGIPEAKGGAGGEMIDLLVFVESLSQNIEPTPFIVHAAALQTAIAASLDVRHVLERGDLLTFGAIEHSGQRWGEWSIDISESHVEGRKICVPYGSEGRPIVVLGASDRVALMDIKHSTSRDGLDRSLQLADVQVSGTPRATAADGADAFARGALVLAASALGTARGALRAAADYATTRHQFGQPIGSFQGIAHMLSDCFVDVEAAWSLILYAGWCYQVGNPGARTAAHAAIAKAGATVVPVTERALQVHGGIGVTWEADPHLYIRRAMTLNALTGGYNHHFRAVGAAVTQNVGN